MPPSSELSSELSSEAQNIPEAFERTATAAAERVALVFYEAGACCSFTWRELVESVTHTAAKLRLAGCRAGDRVVQVSENRWEWIVTDLAILFLGGIHVPMHATLSGPQLVRQIRDAAARLIIVSGAGQLDTLAPLCESLPEPVRFFSHDICDSPAGAVRGLAPQRLSDAALHISPAAFTEIVSGAAARIRPEDVATILYTSGTTGDSKGVMLTHANLMANTRGMLEVFATGPEDLRISVLPWSHVFGRTCDLYAWIVSGSTLAIAESRERLIENCRELRPTLLNAVPYFFERLYRFAAEQGRLSEQNLLQQLLGGRVRACCSGGAALPRHVAEWFREQGVPLVEGYGLTETSPVITAGSPSAYRIGTVGRPLCDVEVRIAADGEVLTRGPHVMLGYYNNAAATAEAIRDGWFHTGDLGTLDDGYLTITGRKKELIVTAGGKNIAPTMIEALLSADPLIHQAVVVGDGRNYLAALIVPSPDALRQEMELRGITAASREEVLAHPAVLALYAARIAQRLCDLSRHEQIGRFCLLSRALSQEAEELTPTLKLRRSVIANNFAAEIASLY